MAQIIAGIYEIQERIGDGGGGIVYLARHLRLEKQVVLKADKRTLNTRSEALRREVDMLKGLSHTYIPQVYDFVQENGVVYTVMDFIEGESLDKILRRGELPSQPQVIHWACQLLEALIYLHDRPPHGILHGDIKPANIMLRPNGDICLIDYNIALALGENGAVKVGRSRGYASPEHYGMNDETVETADNPEVIETVVMTGNVGMTETMLPKETEAMASYFPLSGENSTSGHRSVMLDVRSDIYSLGATIYHLISGRRPVQNAYEVEALGSDVCSLAVSDIIKKAMAPDPAMRYQSAKEMLSAFLQLHKKDRRVLRHRRQASVSAAVLLFMLLVGGGATFTGLKQLEQRQNALTLSEYSANELAAGNKSDAIRLALQAIPEGKSILEAPVTAQARKALTDALGVYNLADGFHVLDTIELPSAPFGIDLSPGGARFVAVYQSEAAVYDLESGHRMVALPIQNSALSDAVFVDESILVYAGEDGVTAYHLDNQKILWTGEKATTLSVSANRMVVAAVNRDEERAVIYRSADGSKVTECSFAGRHMPVVVNDTFANPNDSIFSLNEDGSMLAVSFSDGGLQIFNLNQSEEDLILYDESEYTYFEGGFCGKYFAFTAEKSGESLFGLLDTKEAIYLGGFESQDSFLLKVKKSGIYLASGNLLVSFDPDTLEETELAYTDMVNIIGFSIGDGYVLTATEDAGFSFYDSGANQMSSESAKENCDFVNLNGGYAIIGNRNEPSVRLMKLENHENAQLLSYDARYIHDEARISQDGRTAMLFDYQGFRIYDMDGQVLNQVELPDPEQIYDQQFRKSEKGSWLEVIWYDGVVRCYSAADGSLIETSEIEPPSIDLYEEFYTDDYRFASPLHGVPEVYDRETNRLVAELEKDAYLTYVTSMGEYIITEYISADGKRYGLLLDDKLQTVAYLPGLCDVTGEMLVFDDKSGNLRQSRLYSLQELKALGESNIQ